jgi:hypothetical protein
MNHATRTIPQPADNAAPPDEVADGAAVWVVLFAAVMVAALTLFSGANLLGDRFDPAPVMVVQHPA